MYMTDSQNLAALFLRWVQKIGVHTCLNNHFILCYIVVLCLNYKNVKVPDDWPIIFFTMLFFLTNVYKRHNSVYHFHIPPLWPYEIKISSSYVVVCCFLLRNQSYFQKKNHNLYCLTFCQKFLKTNTICIFYEIITEIWNFWN